MSAGEPGRLSRRRAIAGLAGAAIAGGATVWPLGEGRDAYPSIPAADGPLLWTAEVKLAADEFFGPVTAECLVLVERPFVARGPERWTVLSCLDTATGRRLWSVSLGRSPVTLRKVVVSGSVVLARTSAALHAFDLHTGRLLWRRERNTSGSPSLMVTVGGGLVHDSGGEENATTTTSRHALHAYEVGSGRLRWTTAVRPRVVTADAPIYAAGSLLGTAVMLGPSRTAEAFAYAVDAATGEQRWSRRLGVRDTGLSGVAHAAGTFYVFSREAGVLHAVDASTGTIRWQVRPRPRSRGGAGLSVGERVLDAGVPVVAGTTVYVCDEYGVLHAFDVRDGRRRWAFTTGARPSRVHVVAGPPGGNGLVYFKAQYTGRSRGGSTMYALGADESRPRWQRRADGSHSGPLVSGDMLYVSDGDAITGYDPIDGAVRRRVDLRALGAGGSTELVTDGARVHALSGVQVLAFRLEG
ncbi:PQQ-binding-like beta-propeller repeat protein [Actinomadura alba]|uniref:PQQ-binding-like beta-propeller repeat protein n=1 Tax=Actinomadura alba TaxID=406431 RepID=A0ABR7LSU1_9ACTN|nr:PQQ-binding-like beta-propeller repeat protein [Actinomadura alba]MBC6467488.1 PQQ-binding-like beta-propeller repeat protein [Actinomadura alba]